MPELKTVEVEVDELEPVVESSFNVDDLVKVKHQWVKRGVVVSCEGGDHPSHRHFLVKR